MTRPSLFALSSPRLLPLAFHLPRLAAAPDPPSAYLLPPSHTHMYIALSLLSSLLSSRMFLIGWYLTTSNDYFSIL
ncbi:hypothetical protein OH77DRAFT_726908 [Trametes cingulata]|nr:hypothetical protein OH77DRAFT_726908 [Trametes cingulata]